PNLYALYQNYPNPFNPVTKIKFDIPNIRQSVVTLKIFDVMGREVQTLVNESLQPGTYETTFDGSNLTSGVYFYQLTSGNYKETKKLLLLK
ncbi:MAG: T9SS type A sorting domain-containing protein, partial [Ignavibacteria bacterium]